MEKKKGRGLLFQLAVKMLCFVVFCSLKVPEAAVCSENFNKTACRWDCFPVDLSPCICGKRKTIQIIIFLNAGPLFAPTKVPLVLQTSTCMILSPSHSSQDDSSGLKHRVLVHPLEYVENCAPGLNISILQMGKLRSSFDGTGKFCSQSKLKYWL